MARIQVLTRRDVELATAGIAPGAVNAALAQFARQELAASIMNGDGSPIYDRYVNGVEGADENTVVAPGPIVYVFHWWTEVIEFALKTLVERSPVKTGRYRRSWFVFVNGSRVQDYTKIPIGSQVFITNDQPYSRKIDTGFMKMSVPPFVVDDARKIVMGRFGNLVTAQRRMIRLPNPYILKGVFKRGIRQYSRRKLQKDTMAGAEMTYPSLMIEMRP